MPRRPRSWSGTGWSVRTGRSSELGGETPRGRDDEDEHEPCGQHVDGEEVARPAERGDQRGRGEATECESDREAGGYPREVRLHLADVEQPAGLRAHQHEADGDRQREQHQERERDPEPVQPRPGRANRSRRRRDRRPRPTRRPARANGAARRETSPRTRRSPLPRPRGTRREAPARRTRRGTARSRARRGRPSSGPARSSAPRAGPAGISLLRPRLVLLTKSPDQVDDHSSRRSRGSAAAPRRTLPCAAARRGRA